MITDKHNFNTPPKNSFMLVEVSVTGECLICVFVYLSVRLACPACVRMTVVRIQECYHQRKQHIWTDAIDTLSSNFTAGKSLHVLAHIIGVSPLQIRILAIDAINAGTKPIKVIAANKNVGSEFYRSSLPSISGALRRSCWLGRRICECMCEGECVCVCVCVCVKWGGRTSSSSACWLWRIAVTKEAALELFSEFDSSMPVTEAAEVAATAGVAMAFSSGVFAEVKKMFGFLAFIFYCCCCCCF